MYMIQRIQSVFIFLALLAFASLFVIPFAISDTASGGFLSDQRYDVQDHPALLVVSILAILICVLALLSFKERKKQRRWVIGIIILGILIPVAAFLLFVGDAPNIYAAPGVQDQFGLYVPVAAIIFGGLANYFIAKDEKLVKSMDRLR